MRIPRPDAIIDAKIWANKACLIYNIAMTEQTPPSTEAAESVSDDAQGVTEENQDSPNEATQSQPDAADATEKPAKPHKEVPVPEDLPLRLEAALMTTDRAISAAKLSEILGGVATKPIREAIDELNAIYNDSGRSFRIEQLAGGYQIVTLPKYAQVLANLHKSRQSNKLTAAAMETLAIIAYKQPILRAEIEAIRGVSSGETARSLMEKHLVKIVGRAEEIGRPMLYGTTKQFLEVFGLASLKDLPNAGELRPPKPRALIPAKDELADDGQAPSEQTEDKADTVTQVEDEAQVESNEDKVTESDQPQQEQVQQQDDDTDQAVKEG
ncbi:MAG TPA: SMC-Scp complex subunit ScpB [Phycisphaerales bacterium]|nr:SMC-Scp complex subunit ScpB [Phycisphaerales bacterium]|tara:strand:- start:70384 stop:71361 length:978 start_codon:yes stop_codon:yes gene_type:complete